MITLTIDKYEQKLLTRLIMDALAKVETGIELDMLIDLSKKVAGIKEEARDEETR